MKVQINRIKAGFDDLPLPKYATSGSAGMDLYAAIDEEVTLEAGKITIIPTGIGIALPIGFECQIRSRSGLSAKHGLFGLNAPGTIDSDYRGELKVIIANFGNDNYEIKRGERIAQIVIAKHETIEWDIVDSLDDTVRGSGGFGSTGVN